MRKYKFLFPTLLGGALVAFIYRLITNAVSKASFSNTYPLDAIDSYLEEQMRRLHIPGAMLAIVAGDQIVHMRGFGQSRPGGEVPTAQTPFFIGSVTKSFTALAVMQLVEAGKVDLDAPVQHYLPWFRIADHQASAQITVRHLLNQTSSLPMLAGLLPLVDFDDRMDATEHQVRALSELKITRPVGSACEYSNLNYNILGLVIEAASDETYTDFIQKHIFAALEMNHSYTTKAAAQQNGLAVGYRHWFSWPFPSPGLPVPRGSLPSGQLISCAEDMAHYLVAHLNGGRYGDQQLLSSTSIDQMHHGEHELIMFGMSGGYYGMGWFDIDLGQTKTISHGGNVPDFSAFISLIPGQKRGLVLLLNADPYGLPPISGEVGMNLTALLAGHQPSPIQLDFIQWIMRMLPLIPLFQLMGVISTLGKLRRWREEPEPKSTQGRMLVQHVLLPLIPDLSLAAGLGYLRSSGLLRYFDLYLPDLAWVARISGNLAANWAILRTGLTTSFLWKHHR
jgi:CubicO group peptidase (beta-lactamase class C family)